jgi:hypothetical protein
MYQRPSTPRCFVTFLAGRLCLDSLPVPTPRTDADPACVPIRRMHGASYGGRVWRSYATLTIDQVLADHRGSCLLVQFSRLASAWRNSGSGRIDCTVEGGPRADQGASPRPELEPRKRFAAPNGAAIRWNFCCRTRGRVHIVESSRRRPCNMPLHRAKVAPNGVHTTKRRTRWARSRRQP